MHDLCNDESHNDTLSTDELFTIALRTKDQEKYTGVLKSLQCRGTDEVFDLAHKMCLGDTADERILGAHILGQIGTPGRFRSDEAIDILVSLLRDEDLDVARAAAVSLGFQESPKALAALIELISHPDPRVRQDVVYALSQDSYYDDEASVCARIRLSADSDRNVREEATASLTYLDKNKVDVGEALHLRLNDEDGEIRADALLGLVCRKEQDAVDLLLSELSRSVQERLVWDDALDAASELSDPRLLPVLLQLRDIGVESPYLDDAIKACSDPRNIELLRQQ